jgi:serine/threonine-protein kinase
MAAHATCHRGHEWEVPDTAGPAHNGLTCPVCGAPSLGPTLIGSAAAPTLPLAQFTDSPGKPVAPPRPFFPTIPGYEIECELGHGGMGVVYKAVQLSLKRTVALKMILSGTRVGPAALTRFQTEAESAARLQHPNIVQVYEVGVHEGRPYIALEFVPGGSLAEQLYRTLPSARQAAALVETLARALHHAHQQGIVHRDLKPANILLASVVRGPSSVAKDGDRAGNGPRTTDYGQPKVTDFGLAKRLDGGGDGVTKSGDVLGTPNYMAPEQAGGRTSEAGPACDVYALGAILYECLTGQPPFQGATTVEVLRNVVYLEPSPPRDLRPRVPRDLQTICLTCLRKQPAERYATAEALADDLRAFLTGEPIKARPAQAWERLRGWARRRPAVALALGLSGVAAAGVALGLWVHPAPAVAVTLVLSLALGSWFRGERLRSALREVDQEHLRAERNVERMHLLLETTQRLIGVRDSDELLRMLSETTTRLVNAERATVYLVDVARGELWSKVALGDAVGEIRIPVGTGIAGTVARTGEPINLSDPYSDPRFNPEVDRRTGYVTRSLLTLPMTGRSGRVVGVFQVLNKRGGAFTGEDVELLAALAPSAAAAVEGVV